MIKIKEWLKYGLTLCLLSNVGWFLASADFFLKTTFSKNSFRNTISVKQLGFRSGLAFCGARSVSKLFANAISRKHW